jgi:hypothetical protein
VLCVAGILCLLLSAPAVAQVTGSITGVVFDQNAQPVGGAVVKLTGDSLPGGRSVITPASGQYVFTLLQPGIYALEVTKPGVGDSKRQAIVEVDKSSTVDIVLGLAVKEEILVTADTPVVDLRSNEVDTNYKAATMQNLPLERSYSGMFQLIPGVADNRSSIGPAAGGSRQDNTYLLDGVNITNPGFGYLSSEVNELDIQEVNIKRAGVSAEFGRSAGVVTNAVTRSGSNRLTGVGRIDWLSDSLIGNFRDTAFRDSRVIPSVSPALGIGGPILTDRLFFYGSARYMNATLGSGRTNKLGTALPDAEQKGHELHGKITAGLAKMLINVGYRDRPYTNSNSGLGSGTSATVGSDTKGGSKIATASWAYFPANRSTVEVKYLYMKERNEDVPLTNLGYLPPWTATSPAASSAQLATLGYYTDPTQSNLVVGGAEYTNRDNYRRHEVRGTFTQFLDFGRTNHEVKVGGGYEFGEEDLNRLSNGWGAIAVQAGYIRARYYFTQPSQLGQGRTWSAFFQDNVTIGSRVTVNAGLLMNRDEFSQMLPGSGGCPSTIALKGGAAAYESNGDNCTFLRFGLGSELQPRIGATVNLLSDKSDKLYGNFGRYYAMDQKSSGRSLAPRRIYQQEVRFNYAGTMIYNQPRAATTGKMIDPGIKPTYNDEALLGYAKQMGPDWTVDVFWMWRNAHNFIEDVPSKLPDSGPYAAANLPCSRFESCSSIDGIPQVGKRTYKSVSIELSKRLSNKWSTNVSYTWSRFVGNFDLDYSGDAVFNTSSYIQDGQGTFVGDPNRYGPLRQDRPHVFKVFATWVPVNRLTLGGYFRVQSGTPWAARGQDNEGGAALNYLEPAGSHRNPTWANMDLLTSYNLPLSGKVAVLVEARVLNLFGNQTQISTDSVKFLTIEDFTGNYIPASANTTPNSFFGKANGYAPPRRLVLAAKVSF